MKKNKDVLVPTPEYFVWSFQIAPQAETASQATTELLKYVETVLEVSSDLFRILKTRIPISCYPEDIDLDSSFEQNPEKHLILTIQSLTNHSRLAPGAEYRVTYDDLIAAIDGFKCPSGTGQYVQLILLEGIETKVRLSDGDYWVSRDSDRFTVLEDGTPTESRLGIDPLHLEFYHRRDMEDKNKTYYKIEVYTKTDIWFEESDLGRANRERLSRFLQTIANLPNVECIDGWTDDYRFSDEEVRELAINRTE